MQQFIRQCNLVVSNNNNALDFGQFRVVFEIKKTDTQTPNEANIKVYNVSQDTINQIKREFSRVVLQAGYEQNYGVIFDGTIKQVKLGKDNGTDTYMAIYSSDGDIGYNFSTIATSLASGATQQNQLQTVFQSMGDNGVQGGYSDLTNVVQLARGKVMYGMARDYARGIAQNNNSSWSIQDGKMNVIPIKSVLPSQAVVLNSKSGLVGTPEQSNDGIMVKCLLNPLIKVSGKVIINEEDVALAKITGKKNGEENTPATIAHDGAYKVIKLEYNGDSRGTDWYCNLTCIDVDESADKYLKTKG